MKSSANTDKKNELEEMLKRKLRETEARVTSRLLLSAQQSLTSEEYLELANKFEENSALDLLQMERDIADRERRALKEAEKIVEAAKEFKILKKELDTLVKPTGEIVAWGDEQLRRMEELQVKVVVKRNKLFSLIDEAEMKKRFADQYEGK